MQGDVTPVRYREFPAPPGTGFACVWTLAHPAGAEAARIQPVVPDGCVDLIWWGRGAKPGHAAGAVNGDAAEGAADAAADAVTGTVTGAEVVVAGPDTGPHPATVEPGDVLVGVRLAPGTAPPALGVPADTVRDGRVPLRELWGRDADRLGEAVAGAEDRRLALAAAVRARMTAPPDPLVHGLVASLEHRSVHETAERLGLGERQLRRRTTAAFGYGPKTLQRVLRFQRALALARAGRPLAEVAHGTGYADQAHMANEVRALAGVPIRALL